MGSATGWPSRADPPTGVIVGSVRSGRIWPVSRRTGDLAGAGSARRAWAGRGRHPVGVGSRGVDDRQRDGCRRRWSARRAERAVPRSDRWRAEAGVASGRGAAARHALRAVAAAAGPRRAQEAGVAPVRRRGRRAPLGAAPMHVPTSRRATRGGLGARSGAAPDALRGRAAMRSADGVVRPPGPRARRRRCSRRVPTAGRGRPGGGRRVGAPFGAARWRPRAGGRQAPRVLVDRQLGGGQPHAEQRAAARRVVDPHLPVVRRHHLGDDRQPQAGAAVGAGTGVVEAHEALEDPDPVGGGHAGPVVGDVERRLIAARARA